jgi:hypothetical protein
VPDHVLRRPHRQPFQVGHNSQDLRSGLSSGEGGAGVGARVPPRSRRNRGIQNKGPSIGGRGYEASDRGGWRGLVASIF